MLASFPQHFFLTPFTLSLLHEFYFHSLLLFAPSILSVNVVDCFRLFHSFAYRIHFTIARLVYVPEILQETIIYNEMWYYLLFKVENLYSLVLSLIWFGLWSNGPHSCFGKQWPFSAFLTQAKPKKNRINKCYGLTSHSRMVNTMRIWKRIKWENKKQIQTQKSFSTKQNQMQYWNDLL